MHLISIVLVIIVICITVIVIPDYKEEYQKRTLLEIFQENDINNIIKKLFKLCKEQNDSQDLIYLLDKEYLKKQKLDSSSILDYFEEYKELTSFC